MAHVASDLYGTNLLHFLDEMGGANGYKVDHDNDAVRPALVLEAGEKRWPPPPTKKAEPPKPPPRRRAAARAGPRRSPQPRPRRRSRTATAPRRAPPSRDGRAS